MCSTSSLCFKGRGHALLFSFSSCHWLECQKLMQPSWTTRYKSWVSRTEHQAKVPTMTYKALCDHILHKLSGLSSHCSPIDHSSIATLPSLLVPTSQTLSCHRAFVFAKHSPQVSSWLAPSLPPGLYSNTTFPVRYSWTTLSRISTASMPPTLPPPPLALFSPTQHAIHATFHHVHILAGPTRISTLWGQGFLLLLITGSSVSGTVAWNIAGV